MHSLTPQLLKNYPFSRYADPKSILRGQEYFKDGRVWEITLTKNNSKAVCEVGGDSGPNSAASESWTEVCHALFGVKEFMYVR